MQQGDRICVEMLEDAFCSSHDLDRREAVFEECSLLRDGMLLPQGLGIHLLTSQV